MCECKHCTVLGMSWKISFVTFILQMSKCLVRCLKQGFYCTVLKEVKTHGHNTGKHFYTFKNLARKVLKACQVQVE